MAQESVVLQAADVTKAFPGVRALDGVDFTLRAGEIHALMGENGAGKSTLVKVLTGVYRRDGGQVLFMNRSVDFATPHQAQLAGISTVYQEVNLVPGLSVAENIFLGRQPGSWLRIGWGDIYKKAREAMARLQLDLDVRRPLASYSIAIQQMVAIARALDTSARVLVLDEPTSSLDEDEVQRLFEVMQRLKSQGLGVIFITHFMDQVYQVSDRITVLRNGRLVGSYATAELPRLELIGRMMGKDIAEIQQLSRERAPSDGHDQTPILQGVGLSRRGSVENIDIEVRAGEVVGLAGLLGSGRSETARLLFGVDRLEKGSLSIGGKAAHLRSPAAAIARGLGFCPEDRKLAGILPNLSVRENIVLVLQGRRGWFRKISRRKQNALADEFIARLRIATPDAEKPIRFLSGGNQQKAILARWLAADPKLLILDEPTRGIDVGAKFEIAQVMEKLREKGMGLVLISSELEEVVRSCQRVLVLRDRKKVGELRGEQISEPAIMDMIAHAGREGVGHD